MDRKASLFVAIAALSSSLAACVFFVPAPMDAPSGTCSLTADELGSVCGACVAESCRPALDACCAAGAACEQAIEGIVLCRSDEAKCGSPGSSSAESDLRGCVASRCQAKCGDGSPVVPDAALPPLVDCQTTLETCFCVATTTSGAATAPSTCRTSSSSKGSRCCAETGYPRVEGKRCACRQAVCIEGSSTCTCGYYAEAPRDALSTCNGRLRLCCKTAAGTSCSCKTNLTECPAGEVETSSCSVLDLACLVDDDGNTTTAVSSCSP